MLNTHLICLGHYFIGYYNAILIICFINFVVLGERKLIFKKMGIALALTAGITGIGMATNVENASASTPSFPVHMRGTWHSYSYGSFNTEKITKHTDHYYGQPKIHAWQLEIGHVRTRNGRIGYVPRMSGVDAAYEYYVPTKITWHGHHYRALIVDGSEVYTHHHIRHSFKVSSGYTISHEIN